MLIPTSNNIDTWTLLMFESIGTWKVVIFGKSLCLKSINIYQVSKISVLFKYQMYQYVQASKVLVHFMYQMYQYFSRIELLILRK